MTSYDNWLAREPDPGFEPPIEDDGREAWRNAMLARIKTWPEEYAGAPRDMRWHATIGDFDLDCKVGTGATPEAATEDLLDQLEK